MLKMVKRGTLMPNFMYTYPKIVIIGLLYRYDICVVGTTIILIFESFDDTVFENY